MLNFEYILSSGVKLTGDINYDPAYDRLTIVLEGDGVSVSYESDHEYVCVELERDGKAEVLGGKDVVDSFLDPIPGTSTEEYADAIWAAFAYLEKHRGA